MEKREKLVRTSITLDKTMASLALEMKRVRLAGSMSNYVKGLIALDALKHKGSLDISVVPPWVIVAYRLDVVKGKVQA
jgi:hypothetical protein